MKACKPFRTATIKSISQPYILDHKANDFASFYGDWLVAPFNCKILKIIGIKNIVIGDNSFMEGGCGIRMQSIEDPTLSAVYWHCQPVFPVNEGDIVLQGQPVAMMGNTGFVMSGGKVVPYDIRLKPPYPGTHVHYSMERDLLPVDPSTMIDYTIEVKFNLLDTIKNLLRKISSLLK